MKKILQHLFEHKTLSTAQAKEVLTNMSEGIYNDAQVTAFITVYLMRSIQLDELKGFREALLELCLPINFGDIDSIDVVGTGGDGKNTFNISTLSCFLIAGAGYKVTKHGSYGVSSVSGSSNVLETLGYQFTTDTDILKKQLDQQGICFLHAPFFHPALKGIGPIRRQLGMKTFFNILGPLVNPAQPKKQLLGTFNMELLRLYDYLLEDSGKEYAIVHALDGYDEVSLTGAVKIKTPFASQSLMPQDFGKPQIQQSDIYGGKTKEEAAQIFVNILEGKGTIAQKNVVIANAAIGIQCFKPQQRLLDCVAEAEESLDSGRALEKLKKLTNL